MKTIYAQKLIYFQCKTNKSIEKRLLKNSVSAVHAHEVAKQNQKIIFSLQKQGYLLAQVDTVIELNDKFIVQLNPGNHFKWGNFILDHSSKQIASQAGISVKKFQHRSFNIADFVKIQTQLVQWCENNGYPFAYTYFDSIAVRGDSIHAVLFLNQNQKICIDSVVIKGNSSARKKFFENYLEIKPGDLYNEKKIKAIGNKIKQLQYVKELKPTEFYMDDQSNKLFLFLEKKNSSQFDGIIGILPTDKGKTIFTGDVKIKLQNTLFRSGENLEINWRRLMVQTQDLKAKFQYPFLFNSKIGTEYGIKLYKRDSLFVDINQSFAVNYLFNGLNTFKAIYKIRNSSILSTSGLESLSVLPDYADIKTQSYGFGISFDKLDYRFNPKSGVSIVQQALIGNRTIKKNSEIKESLYNDLILKSTQFQIELDINTYLQIGNKSCIKNGLQLGSVGGNKIFKNELFRIGGYKSIRGFDEESILSSSYVLYSLEYRYLFEENSNLFLFTDWGWFENTSGLNYINDWPKSFGAGINFETKSGILSLAYALGSQFSNPIDIRTGKIHFGLISIF